MFYHVRGFDVDQVVETLMRVATVNCFMEKARMLDNPILSCNKTQKEAIIFLTNKLNREGKLDLIILER